jgi:hypothetical protein
MKKNYKSNKKYITLEDGGCDFRQMDKIMCEAGHKMNHATARNQLILALDSLLMKVGSSLNANISLNDIEKIRNNQDIHGCLQDVLYQAYVSMENEENNKDKETK